MKVIDYQKFPRYFQGLANTGSKRRALALGIGLFRV